MPKPSSCGRARAKNADALYMLGICHNYNLGVDEADEKKRGELASGYFIKAAELGHADAQCFAGLCFLHGIGVEKDEKTAVDWFERSAEQNCTQAMNNLGMLCDGGVGVNDPEKKDAEAFAWFESRRRSATRRGSCTRASVITRGAA